MERRGLFLSVRVFVRTDSCEFTFPRNGDGHRAMDRAAPMMGPLRSAGKCVTIRNIPIVDSESALVGKNWRNSAVYGNLSGYLFSTSPKKLRNDVFVAAAKKGPHPTHAKL